MQMGVVAARMLMGATRMRASSTEKLADILLQLKIVRPITRSLEMRAARRADGPRRLYTSH